MDIGGTRQLPYSIEAEQSVLGCILIDPASLITVAQSLKSDDFYLQQNRVIYDAMLSLFGRNEPVDVITISQLLGANLQLIGGYEYFAKLAGSVPTTENLKYYIKILGEKKLLRRLIKASENISSMSYEGTEDVGVILSSAEKEIYDILQDRGQTGLIHISDVLAESFEFIEKASANKGKIMGVESGFTLIDKMTGGFQASELIIIAARPAMGKTSFALNIAQHAALHRGTQVAIFNLEMSKGQLGNRIIFSEAMISGEKLKSGTIDDNDWPEIARSIGRLSKSPLYIDDTAGITVTDIKAKCRQLQIEKGLGMVIIDYLQLMQGSRKNENRQQEISEISRSLKVMAKELAVPVIALSQLSRAAATRGDHKPQLNDLRESGAIEQDADIVMFIHREDYYNPETEKKGIAECIIAKHRNGSTGTIELVWRPDFTLFMNKTIDEPPYNG